jgi:subtilisin family serine protease
LVESQRQHIAESFPEGIRIGAYYSDPEDPGTLEFLYREGVILVRDGDVERVRQVLNPNGDRLTDLAVAEGQVPEGTLEDAAIAGFSVLAVRDTFQALDRVAGVLGLGVASPDHVLHVTPTGYMCPATEPIPSGQSHPYPSVNGQPDCDGEGVLAMVVDTGFIPGLANLAHPWLQGVTGDVEHIDPAALHRYEGHGTFVAGVLRTMAPRADVHVDGVLVNGGAVLESVIVTQLYLALEKTPDIVSLSAGTRTWLGQPSIAFESLWESRLQYLKGTVLVCAAGNDGNRGPFWPAAFPWAVAVGALDETGRRAGYSNYGSWVDVYALGSDLVNAFPNGVYTYMEPPQSGTVTFTHEMAVWSGTSFATPLVSGLVASRMSRTGESGREAADALLALALQNARRGVGPVLEPGFGCLTDRAVCKCGPSCGCGPSCDCGCQG